MAGCGGKNGAGNLYAALGVSSDCSDAELRSAYRKLAMVRAFLLCSALLGSSVSWLPARALTGFRGQKWHPDKCAAAGSSGSGAVEAAKARFQKIQGAYAGTLFVFLCFSI
jgi:hypothetical protein